MMIKIVLSLLLSTFLSIAYAAQEISREKPDQIPEFPIYAEAKKESKVIEKANLNTPLIKIIQKKEWIKVADRSNGEVGWILESDYKTALEKAYPSQEQTVFIKIRKKKDLQGNLKDSMDMIAYKDGKKLDEKEAQALYEQLQKEQAEQDRAMGQWLRSMNQWFNTIHDRPIWRPYGFEHIFWGYQPVIVIEKTEEHTKKNKQKN